ncbi:MAG: hypothetical protein WEC39_00205 [Patescibacteria group bacterium]
MPSNQIPQKYLEDLVQNHRKKIEKDANLEDQLLMYSGARLNWVGEYINDDSINWRLQRLNVDDLTLTGTNPEWNKIILDQAERNPAKLRELMKDPKIRKIFAKSKFAEVPILARTREKEGKTDILVLDGMNRLIAAIRDGISEIDVYVGTRVGKPKAKIEPHVLYDLIRAYQQRGGSINDLIASLRFLVDAYDNTRELLLERFNGDWIRDEELSKKIKEQVLNGSAG